MLLIFAIAAILTLFAVGSALMPARVLPRFVLPVVDSRRTDIAVVGIGIILSIGIGLVVVEVLN
jgi:hypothetical protein